MNRPTPDSEPLSCPFCSQALDHTPSISGDDVERVARAPFTQRQINAVQQAAAMLDYLAGVGTYIEPADAGKGLDAAEVVTELSEAFGIEWDDDFGHAVRLALTSDSGRYSQSRDGTARHD